MKPADQLLGVPGPLQAGASANDGDAQIPSSGARRTRPSPRKRKSGARRTLNVLLPVLAAIGIAIVWEIAVRVLHVPNYLLPAPSGFIPRIFTDWAILLPATYSTAMETAIGFVSAVVISIPLALLFSSINWLRRTFYPLVVIFQVVPKIALAPVFIVWFGVGLGSISLLTFTLTFFPILANSMTGFMELDERMLFLTRSMGASRRQTLRYLRMQAALPYIFAGLRIAIVLATTGAIVGEFVGSNSGLGYTLQAATGNLDGNLVFADLVVLSALGLVFYYVVVLIEWLSMPWARRGALR